VEEKVTGIRVMEKQLRNEWWGKEVVERNGPTRNTSKGKRKKKR